MQRPRSIGVSMKAPALTLLAGYSAEIVLELLDTIAGQAFSLRA